MTTPFSQQNEINSSDQEQRALPLPNRLFMAFTGGYSIGVLSFAIAWNKLSAEESAYVAGGVSGVAALAIFLAKRS